ncbi:MAG: hypothetical protein FJW40_23375 [Acidobacteria bacterium]|nr:hypothetical protein [Acidobacteriota bacterium]
MEWTRSDTLALAANSCSFCHGLGIRIGENEKKGPCNCVFRSIFRICYNKFRACATKEKMHTRCTLERIGGRRGYIVYSRKDEEYVTDFILLAKRELSEQEYQIFNFHYILGADWRLCCKRLKMDRGAFFHFVYRIQHRLGRVMRELQPYSLFPLDRYFDISGSKPVDAVFEDSNSVAYFKLPEPATLAALKRKPLRPPLRPVVILPDQKAA